MFTKIFHRVYHVQFILLCLIVLKICKQKLKTNHVILNHTKLLQLVFFKLSILKNTQSFIKNILFFDQKSLEFKFIKKSTKNTRYPSCSISEDEAKSFENKPIKYHSNILSL